MTFLINTKSLAFGRKVLALPSDLRVQVITHAFSLRALASEKLRYWHIEHQSGRKCRSRMGNPVQAQHSGKLFYFD